MTRSLNNESIYYRYYWSRWLLFVKITFGKRLSEVHGIVRRNSSINTQRIDPLISEYSPKNKLYLFTTLT